MKTQFNKMNTEVKASELENARIEALSEFIADLMIAANSDIDCLIPMFQQLFDLGFKYPEAYNRAADIYSQFLERSIDDKMEIVYSLYR